MEQFGGEREAKREGEKKKKSEREIERQLPFEQLKKTPCRKSVVNKLGKN